MGLPRAALVLAFLMFSAGPSFAAPPSPPRELAVPAEAGNTQAMVRLGRWHMAYGNVEPARELFERSARRDELDGMLSLHDLYGLQLQHEPDALAQRARWLNRAKALLQPAAERGDAAAQLRLAQVWERDIGNASEAVRWYRAAADAGSSEAMYALSQRYRLSWGVEESPAEALTWLTRAGEHGHRAAMEDLARRYAAGDGVPANAETSLAWKRRAEAAAPSIQVSTSISFWDFPQSPDVNGVTLRAPDPR